MSRVAAVFTAVFTAMGTAALALVDDAGGIALLGACLAAACARGRLDGRELWRHLYKMGTQSVPIVALTALFTGGILVIQSGIFVRRFGAYGLLGFGAGYATLREVGPVLIGLMFSGRVGANNAAELGTMAVTEQLDGLRALAIEPIGFLIAPRVVAMMIALACLLVIGDAVAILGGALAGQALLGVDLSTFFHSFAGNLKPWDLWIGLIKAALFGLAISLTSCYYGARADGGAVGVGRAVNRAVVAAAVAIMLTDNLVTLVLR